MTKADEKQESYVSVSIPVELADEVDKYVLVGYMGYKTRAEFIKTAIRGFVDSIKMTEQCSQTDSNKKPEVEA